MACLHLTSREREDRERAVELTADYCSECMETGRLPVRGAARLGLAHLFGADVDLAGDPVVSDFLEYYRSRNYVERAKLSEIAPAIGSQAEVLLPTLLASLKETVGVMPCELVDNIAWSVALHRSIVESIRCELAIPNPGLFRYVILAWEMREGARPLLPNLYAVRSETTDPVLRRAVAGAITEIERGPQ